MATRRGPGRPKKQRPVDSIPKRGIVSTPSNVNAVNKDMVNAVEILYENPLMFKKIFGKLKTMKVSKIPIYFKKEGIVICTKDHTESSIIYIEIKGHELNSYFCEDEYSVILQLSKIEPVINAIDKEFTAISFKSQRLTKFSKLTLALKHNPTSTTPDWDFTTEPGGEIPEEVYATLNDEVDYPVKFVLPSRFIKKRIKSYSTQAEILKITHIGGSNVRFEYTSSCDGVKHRWPFKNNIKLDSKVPKGELFIAPVYISDIKSVFNCIIADDIHISADKYKRIIFTSYLDIQTQGKESIPGSQTCTIKIMTNLVEFKK